MSAEIYAATTDGVHEVVSGNRDLHGRDTGALVRGPRAWWALAEEREVLMGAPGDWRQLAISPGPRLNCLVEVEGSAVVGTSEAHLLHVSDGVPEAIESFEDAPGRSEWFTPWGGPPDVRSLATTKGRLLANVHVGGILRADDPHATWTQTIDIRSDVHEVYAAADSNVVLAATAWGLAVGDEGGGAWTFESEGLHATYARAVGLCGETILLTASTGPSGGRAAVYRRPLHGNTEFEKCEQGLPEWFGENIDTGCLATAGERAAFGTSDGRVFVSDDAGASWDEAASGLSRVRAVALA